MTETSGRDEFTRPEDQAEMTTPPVEDAAKGSTDEPSPESPEVRKGEEANDAAGGSEESLADASANLYEETFKSLSSGETVNGTVVDVQDDEVLVDVGYKTEGRIPLGELGLNAGQTPAEAFHVGDSITATVTRVDDAEGTVLLSRKESLKDEVWKQLEGLYESGEPVEGTVTERVKGGLLIDVGVRGFLPASRADRTFVENLEQFVGQKLPFKVIELDRRRRNVVLSRKELLEEQYRKAKEEIFETLKEGETRDGVVRRLTDFGAFVDIGNGVEGLLHVSEMAWTRVRHPKDVLSEGEHVKVMVLGVDRERERISLGLRQTQPNPWETVGDRYRAGDVVDGKVTRVVEFGAFVELEPGVEGLVHISQLADHHVARSEDVVSAGDLVKVKLMSVDANAQRIGLSIREAQPSPLGGESSAGSSSSRDTGAPSSGGGDAPAATPHEENNGSVTLGDVLGDKLGSVLNGEKDKREE